MLGNFFGKFLGSAVGLIIGLALIAFVGYVLIRRALRKSNLANLASALGAEMKSGQLRIQREMPKSLSGLDRFYLPQIEKAFGDLNIEEFRKHAEVLLLTMLESLEHRDIGLLYDAGPSYKAQLEQVIEDMKSSGQSITVDDAKIHKTVISNFKNTASAAEITFQSGLEARLLHLDKDGQILQGSRDELSQLRYEQTLIYVIDPELYQETTKTVLAANCPNCGAPADPLAGSCAYCGSFTNVIPLRLWVFSGFKQT